MGAVVISYINKCFRIFFIGYYPDLENLLFVKRQLICSRKCRLLKFIFGMNGYKKIHFKEINI